MSREATSGDDGDATRRDEFDCVCGVVFGISMLIIIVICVKILCLWVLSVRFVFSRRRVRVVDASFSSRVVRRFALFFCFGDIV